MREKRWARLAGAGFALAAGVFATLRTPAQGVMIDSGLTLDDAMMVQLDANRDGAVSADLHDHVLTRMFEQMDANHDGAVQDAEHAAYMKALFESMDDNQDGQLDATEIAAAHKTMVRMMYLLGTPLKSDPSANERTMAMDADHDGRVSAAEFADAMHARFAELDANHDGRISSKEFTGAHVRHGK